MIDNGFFATADFFAPFYGFGDDEVVRDVNGTGECEVVDEFTAGGVGGEWVALFLVGRVCYEAMRGGEGRAHEVLISKGDKENGAAARGTEPFVGVGDEEIGIESCEVDVDVANSMRTIDLIALVRVVRDAAL